MLPQDFLTRRLRRADPAGACTVTHDLRMCKYVDRVLQMRDGKLVQVIEDKNEIEMLARGGLVVVTS